MATRQRIKMHVPTSVIRSDVLLCLPSIFLTIAFELVFGDMMKVEGFLSVKSLVLFCSSTQSVIL